MLVVSSALHVTLFCVRKLFEGYYGLEAGSPSWAFGLQPRIVDGTGEAVQEHLVQAECYDERPAEPAQSQTMQLHEQGLSGNKVFKHIGV